MAERGCCHRYRHSEGFTSVSLTGDRSKLITAGSDGEIRIYKDVDDDEPITFSASDSCLGMTCFENKVFVGTDNNTVEVFELPKGKNLGVKAKLTAAVNHVDVSKDGKWLVAGGGDMSLQILCLSDTSQQPRKLDAHRAPVLSISIDPLGKYVVSAGCDGNVCVWLLIESVTRLVKRWEKVFPSSNDISLSPTLCRISWSPDGNYLAVPQEDMSVSLYSRDTWELSRGYKTTELTKMISVTAFSKCGTYFGGGASDGSIMIWDAVTTNRIIHIGASTDKHAITGITFDSSSSHVYFTDDRGRLGHLDNFISTTKSSSKEIGAAIDSIDPFDDGMDDLFDDADNENEISISKIKAELGFTEDEYVGVAKASNGLGIETQKTDLDDDVSRSSTLSTESKSKPPSRPFMAQPTVNPFTERQGCFQPSSTPAHLEHRFMVWNNVGIIRSYSTEDDEAIDIEFHDASFHNSIHLRNQFEFIYGTLSTEAIVLACEKGDGHPSKVFCLNFASWDSSKEWTVDLPKDEEVTGVAVGNGWIAASTTLNRLRLFSIGGCQRFIYDLPGPIVALSGFESVLFLTYHAGVGVHGDQSIAYSLLRIRGCKLCPLRTDIPLPLSPKSTLTWIGFTDEGSPTFSDSKETFRILNGDLWTPYCSMKELLSGPNDHFWIVGASETGQNIRAIKCKGTKYPATLPRPTLMILDAKIPVCELDTEKSQMEEGMLRAFLLNSISRKMEKKGFDVDEFKEKADKDIRDTLMKLFILSSKGDRDLRASEYISLMPSAHAVQVAVKYASRVYRSALSDRLSRIGKAKLDEDESDEDDFETRPRTSMPTGNICSNNSEADSFCGHEPFGNNSMPFDASKEAAVVVEENPLMTKQKDEIRAILTPASAKNNPFQRRIPKPTEDESSQNPDNEGGKGLAFIDAWKKPPEKAATIEFNPKHPQNKKTKRTTTEKDKSNPGKKAKLFS